MAPVDVAIIGSGINALVAGALLSRSKKRVLVLERESRAGGCMRTEEVTLPGYHHDVMAATFVLFMTSPGYAELAEDLARHGLEFCHTTHPTAVLRPNGNAVVLGMDRAANVAAFNALHAGDGDSHAADVGQVERDAEFLFALLGGHLWTRATAWLFARRAWKHGLNGTKAWIGEGLKPARAWLEWRYGSEDIQALWAPWVLHTGLTPESTYSAQMGKVIAFALEAAGAPVVKGGAARAADALVALIEANGGEVRTGADVDRITVTGGRASGVVLADGDEIAAETVVASVPPGQLHERLLRDHDSSAKPDCTSFRHGRGNFQLHYALDGQPEWCAEGLDDVALIHLADSIDSVSKSSNEAERGLLPECPTVCVGQPHRLDPTRCPEGKGILWLQIPDAPRTIKGDAAGTIETQPQWSEAVREAFADRIEEILARSIRNFETIKLNRRAYSPADLESMNINLVGGDPYGGSCTIDQFFTFRPFADSRNSDTHVKNLFQIGASVHPGPGAGRGIGLQPGEEAWRMTEELEKTAARNLGEIGLENFAPYLMNRIMGRYNASLRDEMARLGLTTPKMRSLAVLSVVDGLLIGELAVYAVVENSTLSRALDGLEAEGLVRRQSDSADSRATRIFLTEEGRTTFDRIWPHMENSYRHMFRGIDEPEMHAFVGTLQTILRNIRKHDF